MSKQVITLLGIGLLFSPYVVAEQKVNGLFLYSTACETESFANALVCGSVSGRLNTLYYSTHDAYFEKNLNQDTHYYRWIF